MLREIRETSDGSTTIFVPHWDEHYHSIHGARQESLHVFIDHGLKNFLSQPVIAVLEVGFGTGLNALLTAQFASTERKIYYEAIEAYPVEADLWRNLNYAAPGPLSDFFEAIHEAPWGHETTFEKGFALLKRQSLVQDSRLKQAHFDVVYFDAFAPSAQPELWTTEIFSAMINALKPGGILVTYCAKGVVKRAMRSVGFEVIALPGPPGKREMTKAIKSFK
jgi:tRNA U34 5-methylaminomethyl-2-thiouridine-forming methyltransferase MnmC